MKRLVMISLSLLAGCHSKYHVQTLHPLPASAPAHTFYVLSRRGGFGVGTEDRPDIVCRGRRHDDLVMAFRRAVAREPVAETVELEAWVATSRLRGQTCVVRLDCAPESPSCSLTVFLRSPSNEQSWEANVPRESLYQYTRWFVFSGPRDPRR